MKPFEATYGSDLLRTSEQPQLNQNFGLNSVDILQFAIAPKTLATTPLMLGHLDGLGNAYRDAGKGFDSMSDRLEQSLREEQKTSPVSELEFAKKIASSRSWVDAGKVALFTGLPAVFGSTAAMCELYPKYAFVKNHESLVFVGMIAGAMLATGGAAKVASYYNYMHNYRKQGMSAFGEDYIKK